MQSVLLVPMAFRQHVARPRGLNCCKLLNLVANAVKFTLREGRPIAVRGRNSREGVEIAVADSGIGIAPEEQVRIFEEFTQVEGGRGRRLDGTGLGLALTKKIVEFVGGNLRVDNELGTGSTFTVWLPGAPAGSDPRLLVASLGG